MKTESELRQQIKDLEAELARRDLEDEVNDLRRKIEGENLWTDTKGLLSRLVHKAASLRVVSVEK